MGAGAPRRVQRHRSALCFQCAGPERGPWARRGRVESWCLSRQRQFPPSSARQGGRRAPSGTSASAMALADAPSAEAFDKPVADGPVRPPSPPFPPLSRPRPPCCSPQEAASGKLETASGKLRRARAECHWPAGLQARNRTGPVPSRARGRLSGGLARPSCAPGVPRGDFYVFRSYTVGYRWCSAAAVDVVRAGCLSRPPRSSKTRRGSSGKRSDGKGRNRGTTMSEAVGRIRSPIASY